MILALDPGYGNEKIYGANGPLIMIGLVATNDRAKLHDGTMRGRKAPLSIQIGQHSFYVGSNAHSWGRPVESLNFDRFTGTPEMRALLGGIFTKYQLGHGEVLDLILGVPLNVLQGASEAEVKATVRRIRSFFVGNKHKWTTSGEHRSITIASLRVASQAVGSLFDYFLDDDGHMTTPKRIMFKKREVGIVNVGFNTLDLLVAQNGQTIQRFAAGDKRGVRRLLDLADRAGLYSLGELDERLRSKALNVDDSLPIWRDEVLDFIERSWGSTFKRFAVVYCVGGGTVLLRDALVAYFGGKARVADDPVISTARGLYKYAIMKAKR